MDQETADRFVASLSKTIQVLCRDNIKFSSVIEVIGHIHINIDRTEKLDYVLTVEVSKPVSEAESVALFSSHSSCSKPPAISANTNLPATSDANVPSINTSRKAVCCRRKTHQVPRVDYLDGLSIVSKSVLSSEKEDITEQTTSAEPIVSDVFTQKADSPSIDSGCSPSGITFTKEPEESILGRLGEAINKYDSNKSNSSVDVPAKMEANNCQTSDLSEKTDFVLHMKQEPLEEPSADHSPSSVDMETDMETEQDWQIPSSGDGTEKSIDRENMDVIQHANDDPGEKRQPYPVMFITKVNKSMPAPSLLGSYRVKVAMPSVRLKTVPPMLGKRNEGIHESNRRKNADSGTQTSVAKKRPTMKKIPLVKKAASGPSSQILSESPSVSSICQLSKGNYMEYSAEDVNEAIELIHKGMPVIEAGLKFGIPRATLFKRSRYGCSTHAGRCSEVGKAARSLRGKSRKKPKVMKYTDEQVEHAIEAVHNGLPVIDAAILHDIPRATLFIRSRKGCPSHTGRCSTVATAGQLKRSKVSRYRYLELMQGNERSVGARNPSSENEEVTVPSTSQVAASDKKEPECVIEDTGSGFKIVKVDSVKQSKQHNMK